VVSRCSTYYIFHIIGITTIIGLLMMIASHRSERNVGEAMEDASLLYFVD
jgi:hypothetical protein